MNRLELLGGGGKLVVRRLEKFLVPAVQESGNLATQNRARPFPEGHSGVLTRDQNGTDAVLCHQDASRCSSKGRRGETMSTQDIESLVEVRIAGFLSQFRLPVCEDGTRRKLRKRS